MSQYGLLNKCYLQYIIVPPDTTLDVQDVADVRNLSFIYTLAGGKLDYHLPHRTSPPLTSSYQANLVSGT